MGGFGGFGEACGFGLSLSRVWGFGVFGVSAGLVGFLGLGVWRFLGLRRANLGS